MSLQNRYLISGILGVIQGTGIVGLAYGRLTNLPYLLFILTLIVIIAAASTLTYYTLFKVLPRLKSNIAIRKTTVAAGSLFLLGILTFLTIPVYDRLSGRLLHKIEASVGLVLFFTSVFICIFSYIITLGRTSSSDESGSYTIDRGRMSSSDESQPPGNSAAIIPATFSISFLVFFSICMIYLLAYYPGIMSEDTYTQWKQMESFQFNDWHPAFSTLLNRAVTRIWHSPTAIGIFDSLLFSLVFAAIMVELKRKNVNKLIFYLTAAVFALNPVNGIMSITLWKDIPYSISLLWISLLLIKICFSGGNWLKSWKNAVVLGLSLAFCALIRHNGIVPVILVALCLPFFYLKYWKQWLISSGLALLLILFIKGPIYDMLEVTSTHPFQTLVNPIMQVGGIVTGGGILTDSEKKLVNEILPLEKWKTAYTKYSEVPLASTPGFNMNVFKTKRSEFLKAWFHMALRNPGLAIKAYLDRTAIIWRVTNPPDTSTFTNGRNITTNTLGFVMNSKLPGVKRILDFIFNALNRNSFMWLFWKPATYMLIMLLAGVVLLVRGGVKWILPLLPAIGNTLGLLIVTTSNQTRYYYATLIIAPLIVAVALCHSVFITEKGGQSIHETNNSNTLLQ